MFDKSNVSAVQGVVNLSKDNLAALKTATASHACLCLRAE